MEYLSFVSNFKKLKSILTKMELHKIFQDKSLKQKAKTEILSRLELDKKISINELLAFAQKADDTVKATCIESLEYTTKHTPSIANDRCLQFVTQANESPPPQGFTSLKLVLQRCTPKCRELRGQA